MADEEEASSGPTSTRHVLDVDDLGSEGLAAVLALAEKDPADYPVCSTAGAWPCCSRSLPIALATARRWPRWPSAATRSTSRGPRWVSMPARVGRRRGPHAGLLPLVLCARVMDHGSLVRMGDALDAAGVAVPVVNLLSDRAHPCQALADLLTLRHVFGPAPSAGRRSPTSGTPTTSGDHWPRPHRWAGWPRGWPPRRDTGLVPRTSAWSRRSVAGWW